MMTQYTTKPIKEINAKIFRSLIKGKEIIISNHALFHLSNRQRKVFNKEELINMVSKETPRKVLLQKNGRYATYYRKHDGFRKLIIEIENKNPNRSKLRGIFNVCSESNITASSGVLDPSQTNKTIIVSFMDILTIPRWQKKDI